MSGGHGGVSRLQPRRQGLTLLDCTRIAFAAVAAQPAEVPAMDAMVCVEIDGAAYTVTELGFRTDGGNLVWMVTLDGTT